MKLSNEEIISERKRIYDMLKNVPEGTKIKFDNELLEQLIFFSF